MRKIILELSKFFKKRTQKKSKIGKKYSIYNSIYKIILILILSIIYNFIETFKIIKIQKEEEIKYYYSKRQYNKEKLVTFSEKLNWLAVNDVNRLKGKCADKILLQNYAKKKIGKDICNKILKIYNHIDEIDFNELPEQFVLKTNHGSGFTIIVDNKNNLNIEESKRKLNKWIQIDYGKGTGEFHYSFIKKKIFAEEFLGNQMKNYKFLCYNGKPKYVYLSIKIDDKKYRNFYDMDWNFLNFHCLSEPHPTNIYKKPKYFELMKK